MKISSVLSRKNISKGLVLVVGLVMLWLLRPQVSEFLAWVGDRQAVTDTVSRLGAWGPLVLFVLLVLQVFIAVIPGHALILTGGYVFGFVPSLLITLGSTVLGSQIAFSIARRYGRQLIYRLASPETIEKWDHLAANQGGTFYFFAFIVPIFPADLMCYVAGLGTISSRRFFLANLLGRFVCAASITLLGSQGMKMSPVLWVVIILGLAAIGTAWVIYNRKSKVMIGAHAPSKGAKHENRHSLSIVPAYD